jgi:endoglucanase
MDYQKHLIDFSTVPGVSGYEEPVRSAVRKAWQGLADEFTVDALGSLIATRKGSGKQPRKRLLVTGHMDEIGLMVTRVDGDFLRVARVGGTDRRILLSQPVIVHAQKPIRGLIGSRPPHVLGEAERKKFPDFEDVVIDTGLTGSELKRRVPVGTVVSFDIQAVSLNSDLVTGKAMDNRAATTALTGLLHELQGRTCQWDVLVASTVQEEVTLGGGETVAWRTMPDLCIVIDTGWALGVGVSDEHGFPLGEGPTLTMGPNAHPKLFDMLMDKANELEIPLATEPFPGSPGAESWVTQVSRDGIPSVLLSIPIRNMHSPVEIVSAKDVERAARLIAGFAVSLDDETLDKLALDE